MLLWGIGMLGLVLRLLDVPVVPVILGLILGPMIEQQMRRALAVSQGDWSVFVTHPLSGSLLLLALILVLAPAVLRLLRRRPAGAVHP